MASSLRGIDETLTAPRDGSNPGASTAALSSSISSSSVSSRNRNRYVSAAAYLGGGWSGCSVFVSSAPPREPSASAPAPRPRARLPPLRGTPALRRQHRPPGVRRQPLIDEDGAASPCPVCLCSYEEALPSMATAQWATCCGHHFHSSCIAKLTRCPMCRSELGIGFGCEWRAVRLSEPVLLKAEFRLEQAEKHGGAVRAAYRGAV